MRAYASRTGTKRNLAALRKVGWRLLISATGSHRDEGFPYGLDNGAWTAFQQGRQFDRAAFLRLLGSHGAGADWCVVPDIVQGGMESLEFSRGWLGVVLASTRTALIAVQDGMTPGDVAPLLGSRVGIAVGGSTDWKEKTAREWGALSREAGCYLHILRVNSRRRIFICQDAGAHSFDGTSVTRFASTLPRLDYAVRQQHLWSGKCL